MTNQGAQNAITKHRVQPPSVNTENYNIFYKFQYLSHLALIGSQTLKWLCCVWDDEQKSTTEQDFKLCYSCLFYSIHYITFHSGGIFLFIVLFGPFVCVSQEAALRFQGFFSLILVHTLDNEEEELYQSNLVHYSGRFVLISHGSVQAVQWSKCINS